MRSFTIYSLRSVSLDRKERFEICRLLERDSLSKDGFFSKGVTTACLKREVNFPVVKSELDLGHTVFQVTLESF